MLKPLRDQVVVKRHKADEKVGSIIIASPNAENKLEGEVVAVGKGHLIEGGLYLDLEVVPGDQIVFGKAYLEVKHEEEAYLIMREDNILAIMK
jgi:chaperonin GroES